MSASLGSIYSDAARSSMPGAMQALLDGGKALDKETREKVAMEFESMFLSQMLQALFPEENQGYDGEEESIFGQQDGDATYKAMMVDEYAKNISASGGIGIAEYVQRELLKNQEAEVAVSNKQGEAI